MQMPREWKPDIRAWGMSASTNPLMKASGLGEMAKRSWKHNIYSTPIKVQQQSPSHMGHGPILTWICTKHSAYNSYNWITKAKDGVLRQENIE